MTRANVNIIQVGYQYSVMRFTVMYMCMYYVGLVFWISFSFYLFLLAVALMFLNTRTGSS